MAHSFKTNSGSRTFGQFLEPAFASDYIIKKKIQSTYCVPNSCSPIFKVSNQSDRLMLRKSYALNNYPCLNSINKNNLYINLITRLDLSDNVIPIIDTSGNAIPAIINTGGTTYTRYNIDPSGNLFGNTPCGINNFVSYLVYNPPPNT